MKKIIKVQSMMRAFLAKRNIATKLMKSRQNSGKQQHFTFGIIENFEEQI